MRHGTLTRYHRWAWHNAHLTRKIAQAQRITRRETKPKRDGKRPARPRTGLENRLSNLHLLLRVPGFARWPLRLGFFSYDVYEKWQKSCSKATEKLRSGITVMLNYKPPFHLAVEEENLHGSSDEKVWKQADLNKTRIASLDIGYSSLKQHVVKVFHLVTSGITSCAICAQDLSGEEPTLLVCSQPHCCATFHTACLALRFLGEEQNAVLPISGTCPTCGTVIQWADLVKELSLRRRGIKELNLLFRNPRQRSKNAKKNVDKNLADVVGKQSDDETNDDENDSKVFGEGIVCVSSVDDDSLPDDWQNFVDEEDADSVTSLSTDTADTFMAISSSQPRVDKPKFKTVIEESDWDGAEILD